MLLCLLNGLVEPDVEITKQKDGQIVAEIKGVGCGACTCDKYPNTKPDVVVFQGIT